MSELPNECWELVFGFLIQKHTDRYLEPISLVSKQFLSITNRLRFSLTICHPFTPRLLRRFPSLTSLDLTRFHGDLHALLLLISLSSLPFQSLNLSHHPSIPTNGLRALAKKIPTLVSLTCSNMRSLSGADLLFIGECFPLLQELDLSFPEHSDNDPVSDFSVKALSLGLPKLRKINLSGNSFIGDASLFSLCKNCEFLEEVVIFSCHFITQVGIASAIRERPGLCSLSVDNFTGSKRLDFSRPHVTSSFVSSLVSLKGLNCLDLSCSSISDELLCCVADEGLPLRKLVLQHCCSFSYVGIFSLLSKCQLVQHLDLQNAEFLNDQHVEELSVFLANLVYIDVSGCASLTDSALFTLAGSCHLLNEIKMGATHIGKERVEGPLVGCGANFQVTALHLGHNKYLRDENVKMFASIFPSLQLLDLSFCQDISEGVVETLKMCHEIRHLKLALCSGVGLLGLNFQVPNLVELNLSRSVIEDEALYVVSKYCGGLAYLHLEDCCRVTAKGVRQVVENCTQLREINLKSCYNVAASVVTWMVFSRPSLRKITAPPQFDSSDGMKELLLRHGCFVC
ncbi:hypothetical protein RJT34_16919 [Clitoria ternatea]|uniref:Uncharacterized protein n=1 Tax=Clitoria ternatea TaxID=43366 RepID=A0AAN9PD98_CLITE